MAPLLQDEQTPHAPADQGTGTHWGDAAQMDWVQMMVFYAAGTIFCFFTYNQYGAPDEGTRSCPTNVGPSSYHDGM
ncbi:UNVERIFIED_CONTAM: hypothetical protein Sradi_4164200 [Sesamum radiatum]|uniref:Uncharacterized protein n=1 Tax=Sesamum radiatum TaxID=300843 RepID=A0AAW2P2C2_SESRA